MTISGFPEWLPGTARVEQTWIGRLAQLFRTQGFDPIETASVERIDDLRSKGEIDKEIYAVARLGAEGSPSLALHYDLTVPFARYVAENAANLAFPFKRYQIQKAWRGERPQLGRFREFYQADIDVIEMDELPGFYDAEVLALGVSGLLALDIVDFEIGVSDRRIYVAYLECLGVEDVQDALRIIDKLDKIGTAGVTAGLQEVGIAPEVATACLAPARYRVPIEEFDPETALACFATTNDAVRVAIGELESYLQTVRGLVDAKALQHIVVDFGFVRGLDYYTGVIFEGKIRGDRDYPSICSGGRYSDLASGFSKRKNQKLPGVGFSIGVTRILAYMVENYPERLESAAGSLGCVLIPSEDPAGRLLELRERLISTGLIVRSLSAGSLKRGLRLADRAKADFLVFLLDGRPTIKFLADGEQVSAEDDLEPLVTAAVERTLQG